MRVSEVERQHLGQQFGEFWEEIFQNALGVAILTVASLESYANELYFERSAIGPSLNPVAVSAISELIEREKILRKFSIALAIRKEARLDLGLKAVQNVDALIELRHAVVHFKSEWFNEQVKHDKLSKQLKGKFIGSPFLQPEPPFPMAWASGAFAEWALRSTVTFLDDFYAEAGIDCPIANVSTRARLRQLSGIAL